MTENPTTKTAEDGKSQISNKFKYDNFQCSKQGTATSYGLSSSVLVIVILVI